MTDTGRVYRMQVRVRYAETDRMGFLHHSRYFVILEMARTEALREHGLTYRELEDAGCFLVVARAQCRYCAPARYDDILTVETRIARLTHTRVDHVYQIFRGDSRELLAEASTTLASVDRGGNIQAMPEVLSDKLRAGVQSERESTGGGET